MMAMVVMVVMGCATIYRPGKVEELNGQSMERAGDVDVGQIEGLNGFSAFKELSRTLYRWEGDKIWRLDVVYQSSDPDQGIFKRVLDALQTHQEWGLWEKLPKLPSRIIKVTILEDEAGAWVTSRDDLNEEWGIFVTPKEIY